MAVFRGFRAFRPSKKNQALIPALPYDVMSSDEAREKVKGNDLSFLHIDRQVNLRLVDNGDLIRDPAPCFYIYRQVMNGREQTGIAGCASIDDYKNNVIKKHEHTLAKKERDRINHVDTCDANTGPIFLTYREKSEITAAVEKIISSKEPEYDFVSDGVRQTVWVVNNAETVKNLSRAFDGVESMYIADGHHRCASAVKVGEMRRQAKPDYTGDEEFNFFLAVAFPDSQLEIMDYNRVVRDLNGMEPHEFLQKVRKSFHIARADGRFKPSEKHTVGMYLDGCWYKLRPRSAVIDEGDPVKRLDVSILQDYLLAPVLNIINPKNDERIDFIGGIRGLDELERRANSDMQLAFAMYPTTVEDLMAIADAGLIMPPKSTWFEPKLLSGLFIHNLSD